MVRAGQYLRPLWGRLACVGRQRAWRRGLWHGEAGQPRMAPISCRAATRGSHLTSPSPRLITCGTVEEKIYRKQVFKVGAPAACLSALSNSHCYHPLSPSLTATLTLPQPTMATAARRP